MVKFTINEKELEQYIEKIMGRFALLVQMELIQRFPASFRHRITIAKEGAAWIVGSNYEILKFYDKGTRAHKIRAKYKKALAFNFPTGPAKPKLSDGRSVFQSVNHPGTTGKKIIETMEKDKALLKRLFERALKSVK